MIWLTLVDKAGQPALVCSLFVSIAVNLAVIFCVVFLVVLAWRMAVGK